MSDKIREFLEVPQQFFRDGNQVRPPLLVQNIAPTYPCSSLHVAQNLLRRVGYSCISMSAPMQTHPLCRIRSNLQGSSGRICSHGFHRVLCETNSYSNVRDLAFSSLSLLTLL